MEAYKRRAFPILHVFSSAGSDSIELSTRSSLSVSLVCPLAPSPSRLRFSFLRAPQDAISLARRRSCGCHVRYPNTSGNYHPGSRSSRSSSALHCAFGCSEQHPTEPITSSTLKAKRGEILTKRNGTCATQPAGSGPIPTPDTADAFMADPELQVRHHRHQM